MDAAGVIRYINLIRHSVISFKSSQYKMRSNPAQKVHECDLYLENCFYFIQMIYTICIYPNLIIHSEIKF